MQTLVILCAILLSIRAGYAPPENLVLTPAVFTARKNKKYCLALSLACAVIGLHAAALTATPAAAFGKKGNQDSDKADKPEKGEKTDKADKSEKTAKSEKVAKPEKAEKPEKGEKKEKKEKKVELTEEDIEAEKAFNEHQAALQAQLKEIKTPFGSAGDSIEEEKPQATAPMTLPANSMRRTLGGRSLSDRLLAPRLYLPGRLIMGHPAEFTIKGRPGHWAALAMADRDSGAKPIGGHTVRLGPDRKVVALGKIPASGVLALKMYSPVAGDLVGQSLYFEAAIWAEGDLSRVEFAQTVTSEGGTNTSSSATNAVMVASEGDRKRGVRIVPDSAVPMFQRANTGNVTLDSGKP
jgi:hypothetical protein